MNDRIIHAHMYAYVNVYIYTVIPHNTRTDCRHVSLYLFLQVPLVGSQQFSHHSQCNHLCEWLEKGVGSQCVHCMHSLASIDWQTTACYKEID